MKLFIILLAWSADNLKNKYKSKELHILKVSVYKYNRIPERVKMCSFGPQMHVATSEIMLTPLKCLAFRHYNCLIMTGYLDIILSNITWNHDIIFLLSY